MASVCIINYGLGNLASVFNALERIGVEAQISSDPDDLRNATHLILPGVGSFQAGIDGLKKHNLVGVLSREVTGKKKPILGICLGMQLFAAKGYEYGEHDGLGFIAGSVVEISTTLRLPHIGWNNVLLKQGGQLTRDFGHEPIFYFVHSYHLVPADPAAITGTCDYGTPVNAILEHKNIFGTQFHPEKSHEDGVRILKNFLQC
jgi:imidazole glycerol-phosphate synthase subunit HisH